MGRVLESTVGGVTTAGRIVETEAYLGLVDPASHAAERIGRTARNDPMYGLPGTAYVYRIYGVHRCLNVVTDREGYPGAVLIRALEPVVGTRHMAERRGRSENLTNGPGRLAQALGLDVDLNRHDFGVRPLRLLLGRGSRASSSAGPPRGIAVSARVGISRAADWPLRFYLDDHPDVSVRRAPAGRESPDFRLALSSCAGAVNTVTAEPSIRSRT